MKLFKVLLLIRQKWFEALNGGSDVNCATESNLSGPLEAPGILMALIFSAKESLSQALIESLAYRKR